ncbi:MAG: ATP synthase F1 subunit delta [Firmicutes bacterium]|nr:ATP synthase F1 subunit delta [Bacillota bacterium]
MKALTRRYASALVDVALEGGVAEVVQQELTEFAELWGGSPELRNFLASPAVPRDEKITFLEKLIARMGASAVLRNFLCVLVDHHRTALLAELPAAFRAELDQRLGIAEVEVTSPNALSRSEQDELHRALERFTGRQVRVKYRQDAGLIGGLVVRMGSTILDGSVRSQLARLRTQLVSG